MTLLVAITPLLLVDFHLEYSQKYQPYQNACVIFESDVKNQKLFECFHKDLAERHLVLWFFGLFGMTTLQVKACRNYHFETFLSKKNYGTNVYVNHWRHIYSYTASSTVYPLFKLQPKAIVHYNTFMSYDFHKSPMIFLAAYCRLVDTSGRAFKGW